MSICKNGSDVLFIYRCNVFLGVSVSRVSEGANDVQSEICFCFNVVCVLFERHFSVECDSQGFGWCQRVEGES